MLAVLAYIAPRVPSPTHLRIVTAKADFDAFARIGEPLRITDGWRKGHEFAYPAEVTDEREWHTITRRIWRSAQPLWAVVGGDVIAGLALLMALRSRHARDAGRPA